MTVIQFSEILFPLGLLLTVSFFVHGRLKFLTAEIEIPEQTFKRVILLSLGIICIATAIWQTRSHNKRATFNALNEAAVNRQGYGVGVAPVDGDVCLLMFTAAHPDENGHTDSVEIDMEITYAVKTAGGLPHQLGEWRFIQTGPNPSIKFDANHNLFSLDIIGTIGKHYKSCSSG